MPTARPTAVVVATVVNTNMSEAAVRQRVVDQLRTNDRSLLDKLTEADADANVVTAVLNVEEFLGYLIRHFPRAVDAVLANDASPTTTTGPVDPGTLSEGEFMDYVLQQLESGASEPAFRVPDAAWQQADDEPIGEELAQRPFLY